MSMGILPRWASWMKTLKNALKKKKSIFKGLPFFKGLHYIFKGLHTSNLAKMRVLLTRW